MLDHYLNELSEMEKEAADRRELEEQLARNFGSGVLFKLAQGEIVQDASMPPQAAPPAPMGGAPPAAAPPMGAPPAAPPAPMGGDPLQGAVETAKTTAAPALEARVTQLVQQGVDPQVAGIQAGSEASNTTIQQASKAQSQAQAKPPMGGGAPPMGGAPMGGGAPGAPPTGPSVTPSATPPSVPSMPAKMASAAFGVPVEKCAEAEFLGREFAHEVMEKEAKLPAFLRQHARAGSYTKSIGGHDLPAGTVDRLRRHAGGRTMAKEIAGARQGGFVQRKIVAPRIQREAANPTSARRVFHTTSAGETLGLRRGPLGSRWLVKAAGWKGKAMIGAGGAAAGAAGTLGVQRGMQEHREAKIEKGLKRHPFFQRNPERADALASHLSKMPKKSPVGVGTSVRALPLTDQQAARVRSIRKQYKKMRKQAMFGHAGGSFSGKALAAYHKSVGAKAKRQWAHAAKQQAAAMQAAKRAPVGVSAPGPTQTAGRAGFGKFGSEGFQKLAGVLCGYDGPVAMGEGQGADKPMWCEQFEGTALFDQAKALEMEDAQLDIKRAEWQSQRDEEPDFYKEMDALRGRKNQLEAQLRLMKLQGGGEQEQPQEAAPEAQPEQQPPAQEAAPPQEPAPEQAAAAIEQPPAPAQPGAELAKTAAALRAVMGV